MKRLFVFVVVVAAMLLVGATVSGIFEYLNPSPVPTPNFWANEVVPTTPAQAATYVAEVHDIVKMCCAQEVAHVMSFYEGKEILPSEIDPQDENYLSCTDTLMWYENNYHFTKSFGGQSKNAAIVDVYQQWGKAEFLFLMSREAGEVTEHFQECLPPQFE